MFAAWQVSGVPPLLPLAKASAPPCATFSVSCRVVSAHSRIIWGAAWSHDDKLLATASRDQVVKVWRLAHEGGKPACVCVLPVFSCPITAVAFAGPQQRGPVGEGGGTDSHGAAQVQGADLDLDLDLDLLSVGREDGVVEVWCVLGRECGVVSAQQAWQSGLHQQHAAAVSRIAWQPAATALGDEEDGRPWAGAGARAAQRFVTCSADHSVRVYSVQ